MEVIGSENTQRRSSGLGVLKKDTERENTQKQENGLTYRDGSRLQDPRPFKTFTRPEKHIPRQDQPNIDPKEPPYKLLPALLRGI